MSQRTLDLSRRERAEAWFFTGPPGRVLSLSIDLTLSLPLVAAYGARKAWRRLRPGSSKSETQSPDA